MTTLDTSKLPAALIRVCEAIAAANGTAWLVGGSVRDMLLSTKPKDFDLEVYGLGAARLQELLQKLGRVEFVGRQFGVFKLWSGGLEIDVALPRTERKTSHGHCGFAVDSDPFLKPETASLRRDFTINALMMNPIDGCMVDFHGGEKDLENSILRHVSEAFSEDPLRPLRAMQFAARFKLTLDHETASLCRELVTEAKTLPQSRVWSEWKKWACAAHPSYGLQALRDSGWIERYPELQSLIECPQNPRWHPEGDVWTHTLLCCDQAADLAKREQISPVIRERLLFATLCHDMGKPLTTIKDEHGNIISPGHSEAGVKPATAFMKHIAAPSSLVDFLTPLIWEHITHLHGKPTERAVRRLSHRLEPANIELWEMLVEADASGRFPAPPSRPALSWLQEAQRLQFHQHKPKALLTGKTLLELGVAPGPAMGEMLRAAYNIQLDGKITDEISAIGWAKQQISPR